MPWPVGGPFESSGVRFSVELGAQFCAYTHLIIASLVLAAYDWLEIVIVREGTGWVLHHGSAKPDLIGPGSVLVAMPDVPWRIVTREGLKVTHLFISTEFLRAHVRLQTNPCVRNDTVADKVIDWAYPLDSQVVVLPVSVRKKVWQAGDKLVKLTDKQRLFRNYWRSTECICKVLKEVAILLKRRIGDELSVNEDLSKRASMASMREQGGLDATIRLAIKTIREKALGPLTVAQVAAVVNLSPGQLRRRFKEAMGKTPTAYRNMCRVLFMVDRLLDSDDPVGMIIKQAGWTNQARGLEVFTEAVKMTPPQFRECLGYPRAGW